MFELPKKESVPTHESDGAAIAERLEALPGVKKDDVLIQKLAMALRKGGLRSGRIFLNNESDKFRSMPDVIAFCAREIFGAGASGLEAVTPWNAVDLMARERAKSVRERTEEEYLKTAVDYALSLGWVKPEQKDLLTDKYLKPLYQRYKAVIGDLKKEGISDEEMAYTMTRLNQALEATRRIGSTDSVNIIQTIADLRRRADPYTEYAITSFLECFSELV